MENYFVKATIRDRDCDKSAAISSLVLTVAYNGYGVHSVEALYNLALEGRLWSKCERTGATAKVHIYWSKYYNRWIATTNRDVTVCDNLLSKPIYAAVSKNGTTTYFDACPL